nr:hypothetical protein [Tanacetum cinerariifolium]
TTPRHHQTSPATPRNISSDSKTKFDPSEDPSEDRSAPLAITPFPDDPYMQIRRAYYATNEESSDSLSSSTILPPPAPVCPRRKVRLLQPYEPQPFMQPFRISTLKVLIKNTQVRYRSDMKSLLDTIHKLKNHNGGPPNY